jgi:hypothetical protein
MNIELQFKVSFGELIAMINGVLSSEKFLAKKMREMFQNKK